MQRINKPIWRGRLPFRTSSPAARRNGRWSACRTIHDAILEQIARQIAQGRATRL